MRTQTILMLLLSLLLLLTACGETTRDEEGEIIEEGDVSAFEMKVGDCFNDAEEDSDLISELAGIPCGEPHDNEVFHLVDYTESDEFPGDDVLGAFAEETCLEAFETYVGISYFDSIFGIGPLRPTAESWAQGDREVICYLYDGELQKLEGSKKGSKE